MKTVTLQGKKRKQQNKTKHTNNRTKNPTSKPQTNKPQNHKQATKQNKSRNPNPRKTEGLYKWKCLYKHGISIQFYPR